MNITCGISHFWTLNQFPVYSVETSDGQAKEEQGELVNQGSENESMVVRGRFSYTGADGVVYTVTYTADNDGFHPEGAHLPKAV